MIKINLLPWREELRQAKKIRFIIAVITAVILAAIIVVLWHFYLRAALNQQNARNTFLQSQIDEQSAAITMLNKKSKAQTKIEEELKFLFNLQEQSYLAVELLDELIRIIPEAISLTKIMRQQNIIILVGLANSDLEITTLLQNLAKSKLFNQPKLTEISAKDDATAGQRAFQIQVQMRGRHEVRR